MHQKNNIDFKVVTEIKINFSGAYHMGGDVRKPVWGFRQSKFQTSLLSDWR